MARSLDKSPKRSHRAYGTYLYRLRQAFPKARGLFTYCAIRFLWVESILDTLVRWCFRGGTLLTTVPILRRRTHRSCGTVVLNILMFL